MDVLCGRVHTLRTTRRVSTPGARRWAFEMMLKTEKLPMSVEFIGFITTTPSETIVRTGPVLDALHRDGGKGA